MRVERGSAPFETLFERDGVTVSRSPWGPEDNVGRLNLMTAESRQAVLSRADGSRVYDLAVDYFLGMPSWAAAGDPRFQMWMTHTPDGSVNDRSSGASAEVHQKYSYCGDSISMYTHTGTHIDMLNHLGQYGQFWNGRTAEKDLGSRQWLRGGADECPPIVGRGVLLDVARLKGVDCLDDGYCIGPDDLSEAARQQGTELRGGDVVLIRTGRMSVWPDFDGYLRSTPGIGMAAARYLCEDIGVMCLGTDAISIDVDPHVEPHTFVPVHCYLFATAGTPVIEVLNLEELSAAGVFEIAFIGMPLKLRGATGSPIRPIGMPLSARPALSALSGRRGPEVSRPAHHLRVALAQLTASAGDVTSNLSQMRRLLEAGAEDHADLVCFPELCLPGYMLDPARYTGSLLRDLRRAEAALQAAAAGLRVRVMYGTAQAWAGRLHNTVVVTERDGARTVYAKAHMVDAERATFAAGRDLVVSADGDLALGCCYDLAFPGFCADLADAGARVLCFPMAWEQQRAFVFEGIVAARAIENIAYIVCVNQTGALGSTLFHGRSRIVDPVGHAVVEMGDAVGLACADLDLDWVTRLRSSADPATYPLLADRRPRLSIRRGPGGLSAQGLDEAVDSR